jgi:hypothetical protein
MTLPAMPVPMGPPVVTAQAAPERRDEVRELAGRFQAKKSHHRHRRLLRAYRKRPRRRRAAAEWWARASSFDHLVGAGEQRFRDGQAEPGAGNVMASGYAQAASG